MKKRKLILNLAISLDGYICEEDGSFDWIQGDGDKSHDTEKQFSFASFMDEIDVIVMGKNAYLDCPAEGMEMYKTKEIYVAASSELPEMPENVKVINGDIGKKISDLQEEEGRGIWLFGGAVVVDAFIKAGIIDEYIIGVIPIILGKGRLLFLGNNPRIDLHLQECTTQEGVVIMRYTKRIS